MPRNDVNKIRYYQGKLKVKRISSQTPNKTAMYEVLESKCLMVHIGDKEKNPTKIKRKFEVGEIINAPCRRCFRNPTLKK